MTSFLFAAGAPLVLALVPCLFSGLKPEDDVSAFVEPAAPESVERAPWWKPTALGIDNYS